MSFGDATLDPSNDDIIDCNGSPVTLHVLHMMLEHLQYSRSVQLINVGSGTNLLQLGQMLMAQYDVYRERERERQRANNV
jgi:hypothetical protein